MTKWKDKDDINKYGWRKNFQAGCNAAMALVVLLLVVWMCSP